MTVACTNPTIIYLIWSIKSSPLLPFNHLNNYNTPRTAILDKKQSSLSFILYLFFRIGLFKSLFFHHHSEISVVTMSFNVYLVDFMGMPRNHHGIFVETHEDGDKTGYLYQVTGNIQTGMIHEHKKAKQPEMSNSFGGLKQLIGTVTPNNYVYIRSVVNGVPPPKKTIQRTEEDISQ